VRIGQDEGPRLALKASFHLLYDVSTFCQRRGAQIPREGVSFLGGCVEECVGHTLKMMWKAKERHMCEERDPRPSLMQVSTFA
jgi:hypothetical protein